jgi:hypothetical protein
MLRNHHRHLLLLFFLAGSQVNILLYPIAIPSLVFNLRHM